MSRPLLALLLLLSACSGDSRKAFGESCQLADECEGGVCQNHACASTCTQDSECPTEYTCGTLADGERVCLWACTTIANPGFACIDGAQVACEQAGELETCGACGCDEGEFCAYETNVCQVLGEEGDPCTSHAGCASRNCTVTNVFLSEVGRCQVARDQPCNGSNCESCDLRVGLGSVCAQSCGADSDCAGNEVCLGREEEGYFCRPRCTLQMPCPQFWACDFVLPDIYYCVEPTACNPETGIPCGVNGECNAQYNVCER